MPAVTIRLGIVGCGSFSRSFIPLFNAHPLVNGVVLCDVDADKLAAAAQTHDITDTDDTHRERCS